MFLEMRFNIPKMAKMLHVSISTIKRRLKECNLPLMYTDINENDLEYQVRAILSQFPHAGFNRFYALYNNIIFAFNRITCFLIQYELLYYRPIRCFKMNMNLSNDHKKTVKSNYLLYAHKIIMSLFDLILSFI